MIVNISSLLNRQEEFISINEKISNFIPDINIKDDIIIIGNVTILNNFLKMQLNISLQLNLICSRCVDSYDYPMTLEINEKIDIDEHKEMIQGDIIDLTELIRENILINIPLKPICNENCKGLCQFCGKNNNVEECTCEDDQVDPRLSVLNKLLNGDE